jgi:hypothetical protein
MQRKLQMGQNGSISTAIFYPSTDTNVLTFARQAEYLSKASAIDLRNESLSAARGECQPAQERDFSDAIYAARLLSQSYAVKNCLPIPLSEPQESQKQHQRILSRSALTNQIQTFCFPASAVLR